MLKIYLVPLVMLFYLGGQAQNIEGWIFDGAEQSGNTPLYGANVRWLDKNSGTATNQKGYFSLENNTNSTIIIVSFVGYKTDTIDVSNKTEIKKSLFPGQEIDEIVVAERVKSTSISRINTQLAQTLDTKELNRFACCNLSESFESNASVDVSYSDAVSGVKQIKLLGLAGRYSQIMLENIPILRGAETAFGLDYIPGTWMKQIHVSKGASAVKNGYESTTGQINIQYKEPLDKEKMHFYTYANQDGKVESNLGYAFKLSEKWGTLILAHGGTHFAKSDMNNDGFLDRPKTNIASFMNRWQYHGDKVDAKFGISVLKEKHDGGQVNFDPKISQQEQSSYGVGIDVEKAHLFSKVGFLLNRPNTSIGTIASANYFSRNSFYGNRVFNADQINLYGNVIFQSFLFNSDHTYNSGISVVYDNNETHFEDTTITTTNLVPGVFLEYNYKPNNNLTLVAGMRYDYSSIHKGFISPRVHLKYSLNEYLTYRGSAGKGYRNAYTISENTNLLASSRAFIFEEQIEQEEAWNYGSSFVADFKLFDRDLTLATELFYTQFNNKLVVDLEQSSSAVHFYNLNGKAYATSLQTEMTIEIFKRFDLTAAFRLNDIKTTYQGGLKEEPFVNKYKGLISAGYSTNMEKWKFDATIQFHGLSRLPSSYDGTALGADIDAPESYINLIAQVTKNHRNWSFYAGVENATNFQQKRAIVDVQNPFGDQFDASTVWGPLYGRMFYVGIKYVLINY